MFENKSINYVFENSIDIPLSTLYSKKSPVLAKIISTLAFAVLFAASLGTYSVYSYFYYQHRKVISLHHQLEKAVKNQNLQTAKNLLETYPHLKTNINVNFLKLNREKSNLSSLLPQAVRNNDLEMVKLLLKYGASPDNKSIFFVGTSLTEAVLRDQLEIVKCLASHSTLDLEIYEIYLLAILLGQNSNRQEIAKCLLEKGLKISLNSKIDHQWGPLFRLADASAYRNFETMHQQSPTLSTYLSTFYPQVLAFINLHKRF